jgi:hypothetical protein
LNREPVLLRLPFAGPPSGQLYSRLPFGKLER